MKHAFIYKVCSSIEWSNQNGSFLEHNLCKLTRFLVDAVGGYVLVKFKVGKALENLLQGGLTHGIILKLVLLLELLDKLEEETD